MNGFSESRIPLLRSLAVAYSLSPIVSSVLVLWGNPSTASTVLNQLARNLSLSPSSTPISLLPQPSASLNNRFLPRPSHISTDAVLICDDDVEVDSKSLEFAFRVWEKNPNRLVGLFAQSHDIDLNRREWVYTVHPDRFSIVLTKFMLLRAHYLFLYTCVGGAGMARARGIVDGVRNCEDRRGFPTRLVGLFAQSHDIDLNRREWVYTVHPDRFSIVLTKFMLLRAHYLFLYTCVGGAGMARARGIVDGVRNCEDRRGFPTRLSTAYYASHSVHPSTAVWPSNRALLGRLHCRGIERYVDGGTSYPKDSDKHMLPPRTFPSQILLLEEDGALKG
ncbi:hypothetical protein DEO72_LG2g4238 [Vigna unguiculata]|uniref:Glycosyl transferase 64 domain-containing protein n=1 Tax=Vigna unguiculata TaxID=3917 RepID=A0A4D6L5Z6_VIGUN|nr:hypothetical protein DEO72_LG2g4238 [Vigna unguiculata]